jgi:thioredoxin reductase (NADPH)
VPGEDLPHVTHRFREGHEDFDRDVVVVGGGNSAVEAALELYRAGARVTLVHFGPTFDRNIKPWVLPDIANRIAEGAIGAVWEARVAAIEPEAVIVEGPFGTKRLPAQRVYTMIGYMPETALLEVLGVPLDPVTGIPAHDPATMETSVPGVFIAGVLASGYDANKTFIENGRGHGELIVRRLLDASGP